MTYDEKIQKINKLSKFSSKLGLERVTKLLNMMGNPQDSLKCIHVAGTNGKGSVCFMLSSILKESGYKTGIFISPHIEDFRERIQINGSLIPKSKVCEILDYFESYLNSPIFKYDPITEFELTTAIAFKYFKDENCDIVVLETGMGGRLDATNVIKSPLCSVITTVSFDHTKILGKNILEIAKEKFGIIKPGCPVVVGSNQESEVYELAKDICTQRKSSLIIVKKEKISCTHESIQGKMIFNYKNLKLSLPLLGEYQKSNISIVLSVIETLSNNLIVSEESLIKGLSKVNVPCRMEIVNNCPLIILDSAHNVEGAQALANFIEKKFKFKNIIGIVGILADKDVEGIFKTLSCYFSKIITIKSDSPRAMSLSNITSIAKKYGKLVHSYENNEQAIRDVIKFMSEKDILIIFGSFSIMKKCKEIIKNIFNP